MNRYQKITIEFMMRDHETLELAQQVIDYFQESDHMRAVLHCNGRYGMQAK
jgi:hypothetical protein